MIQLLQLLGLARKKPQPITWNEVRCRIDSVSTMLKMIDCSYYDFRINDDNFPVTQAHGLDIVRIGVLEFDRQMDGIDLRRCMYDELNVQPAGIVHLMNVAADPRFLERYDLPPLVALGSSFRQLVGGTHDRPMYDFFVPVAYVGTTSVNNPQMYCHDERYAFDAYTRFLVVSRDTIVS